MPHLHKIRTYNSFPSLKMLTLSWVGTLGKIALHLTQLRGHYPCGNIDGECQQANPPQGPTQLGRPISVLLCKASRGSGGELCVSPTSHHHQIPVTGSTADRCRQTQSAQDRIDFRLAQFTTHEINSPNLCNIIHNTPISYY